MSNDSRQRSALARELQRDRDRSYSVASSTGSRYSTNHDTNHGTITDSTLDFAPEKDDEAFMSTGLMNIESSQKLPELRDTAKKYGRWAPKPREIAINTSAIGRAFPDFTQGSTDDSISIEIGRGGTLRVPRGNGTYTTITTISPNHLQNRLAARRNELKEQKQKQQQRPASPILEALKHSKKDIFNDTDTNMEEIKENIPPPPPSSRKSVSRVAYISHASLKTNGERRTLADMHARVANESDTSFIGEERPASVTFQPKNSRFAKAQPMQQSNTSSTRAIDATLDSISGNSPNPRSGSQGAQVRRPGNATAFVPNVSITAPSSSHGSTTMPPATRTRSPSTPFKPQRPASNAPLAHEQAVMTELSQAHGSATMATAARTKPNSAAPSQAQRSASTASATQSKARPLNTSSSGVQYRASTAVPYRTANPHTQSSFVLSPMPASSQQGTRALNDPLPYTQLGRVQTRLHNHGLVDGFEVPKEEEDIYAMVDLLRDQVMALEQANILLTRQVKDLSVDRDRFNHRASGLEKDCYRFREEILVLTMARDHAEQARDHAEQARDQALEECGRAKTQIEELRFESAEKDSYIREKAYLQAQNRSDKVQGSYTREDTDLQAGVDRTKDQDQSIKVQDLYSRENASLRDQDRSNKVQGSYIREDADLQAEADRTRGQDRSTRVQVDQYSTKHSQIETTQTTKHSQIEITQKNRYHRDDATISHILPDIEAAARKPVRVSQRTRDDPDATLRPVMEPVRALECVIQEAEQELALLKEKRAKIQTAYDGHDASLGKRKRQALEKNLDALSLEIKIQCDKIYRLYDVLEGQDETLPWESFQEE